MNNRFISNVNSRRDIAYIFLVYLAISFAQFQNLALRLYGSAYDLSCFLLLGATLYLVLTKKQNYIHWLFLILFVIAQLILWHTLRVAPFHRLISGLLWLGGLLAVALFSHKGRYDRSMACNLTNITMFFMAIHICVESLIFDQLRPSGFLDEPSYAGLLLYAWGSAILFKIIRRYREERLISVVELLLFALLMFAALLTKSAHLFTFVVMTGAVLYVVGVDVRVRKVLIAISLLMCILLALNLDINHVLVRLNFSSDSDSLSNLAWMQGFDQAREAAIRSPLFGIGLGSTGYFTFDSAYSIRLETLGEKGLTLTDAFSGLFRLTVEIGLFLVVVILFLLISHVKGIKRKCRNTPGVNKELLNTSMLAIYGLALLLGVLLKEPSYSRSYFYLGVFLLATNWFGSVWDTRRWSQGASS